MAAGMTSPKERIYLFDTTLRDGAQTSGVNFSLEDKRRIAEALDRLGVDYIEAGWPGANPTDTAFFESAPSLARSRLTAFGMTKRPGRSAANDPGLAAVLGAETPAVCLVGKTFPANHVLCHRTFAPPGLRRFISPDMDVPARKQPHHLG